jgi:ABC-2 type transport system ATP-binding protein
MMTAMIEATDLARSFGDIEAVRGISFRVEPGEVFAFLGPNGAGKTTTMKMLTTLLRPTRGQIRIDGLDVEKHPQEVRRRFGIVFQDPSLDVMLTAMENLELHAALYRVPRAVRRARIEQLLRQFDLWEKRDQVTQGFSGGMKRRLEIVRGFLHTPRVLFLDEPTLGLDPQSRHQLWNQVRAVNQAEGVTVFLTTHYMDEAERVAQRIAIVDHGRIVALGTLAELKAQTGADSLESAFLKITGTAVRDEAAGSAEQMRQYMKAWRR